MTLLVIALLALGLITAFATWLSSRLRGRATEDEDIVQSAASCATCDGTSTRCEQECMMEAATKDIVYYEDENLDRFAGREGNSYDDDEVAEFSDVLYTMRPDEVQGWCRSLTLRGITLPDALKDEVLMILKD